MSEIPPDAAFAPDEMIAELEKLIAWARSYKDHHTAIALQDLVNRYGRAARNGQSAGLHEIEVGE